MNVERSEYDLALERAITTARDQGRAVDARALETVREAIALDLLAEETLEEVRIGLTEGEVPGRLVGGAVHVPGDPDGIVLQNGLDDAEAMNRIHAAMDGEDWNADLWDTVRDIVLATGRPAFRGVDEDDAPDRHLDMEMEDRLSGGGLDVENDLP